MKAYHAETTQVVQQQRRKVRVDRNKLFKKKEKKKGHDLMEHLTQQKPKPESGCEVQAATATRTRNQSRWREKEEEKPEGGRGFI